MPAPISRVIWVRGPNVVETSATERQRESGRTIRRPFGSRAAGDGFLSGTLPRRRPRSTPRELKEEQPVVITIDLDYFADVPAGKRAAEFERVWKFVTECRNLRAVTIAISRPYLKSDEQANDLLRLALKASFSLPTATIQFEPFATVGNDRSLRAREFQKRGEDVPAFKLADAPEEVAGAFAGPPRPHHRANRMRDLGKTINRLGKRDAESSARGQRSRTLDRQCLAGADLRTGGDPTGDRAVGCGGGANRMDRDHAGIHPLQFDGEPRGRNRFRERRAAAAALARDEIAGERSDAFSRRCPGCDASEGAGRDRWSRARDGTDRDSALCRRRFPRRDQRNSSACLIFLAAAN